MNTAIIGRAKDWDFAIPINRAQIANQLIASGKVAHLVGNSDGNTHTRYQRNLNRDSDGRACASI